MIRKDVTALALFSGGLDSILACRVVAAQGIKVIAVKFVTPFFGYDLLGRQPEYAAEMRDKYGIDIILQDISAQYLFMLGNPAHGYGKHFNPCLDCKILMLREACRMLDAHQASFIITGEVVGQRPMSQRHDTLRLIARESGCGDLLVRPLCAKILPVTKPEEAGLVDRQQLLDFTGRDRKPQIALAGEYGISDYPNPAGGCILTDPILSRRIREFYQEHTAVSVEDMLLLQAGRYFRLPSGSVLTLGRDSLGNEKLLALQQPGDWLLRMTDRPGPTGILRYSVGREDVEQAAALVVRYSKKVKGRPQAGEVAVSRGLETSLLRVEPLDDAMYADWSR